MIEKLLLIGFLGGCWGFVMTYLFPEPLSLILTIIGGGFLGIIIGLVE